MPFNCIIIDDEPLAIEVIKNHLSSIPNVKLIGTYNNPIAALDIIKSQNIDLLFLDIEMPLLNGIDFVKTLQNLPKIIFTTAYRNYAIESYELDVIDYLLKPISFQRFFKAIQKFTDTNVMVSEVKLSNEAPVTNDHLYVNENKKYVKVHFDDIQYVESLKDYVRIHRSESRVVTKDSLSDFKKKLPSYFIRIHRSFVVNTYFVTAFTTTDVEIGKKEIPIGSSYKQAVLEYLKFKA